MQDLAATKSRLQSVWSVSRGRKYIRRFGLESDSIDRNCVNQNISVDTIGRVKKVVNEFDPNLPRRYILVGVKSQRA